MRLSLTLIFLFSCSSLSAQSIFGLWAVNKVTAGEKVMTPMAKWTRINKDLSFDSGNGWTKNSEGVLSYEPEFGFDF